jgi:uncharacterized protein (DUF2141 family)
VREMAKFTRLIGWCLIVLTWLPQVASAEEAESDRTGTLIVEVQGLQSSAGKVRFVLFNSEKTYLKKAFKSAVLDIDKNACVWVASDLPYGEYALAVHHDVDGSGKMERHWYGRPKEPGGFSNDAPAKLGPAKYDRAKLVIDASERRIQVTVK